MKQLIVILVIVMFAGIARAHDDPNSMPGNVDLQWSINSQDIATFDIRLSAKYVKVLSRLSNKEVIEGVKQMLLSWEAGFRRKWVKAIRTEDMN